MRPTTANVATWLSLAPAALTGAVTSTSYDDFNSLKNAIGTLLIPFTHISDAPTRGWNARRVGVTGVSRDLMR